MHKVSITVAILAQGTSGAVASSQAFSNEVSSVVKAVIAQCTRKQISRFPGSPTSPRALRTNAVGRRLENMNGPLTEGDRQMRPFCIGHSQQRAGNSSAIMELCQCNPVTQFAWISSTCNTAVRTCLARSPRKSKANPVIGCFVWWHGSRSGW